MLNLIDEHTREGLLVRAERRWSSARVIEALADVMVIKGVPEHIRSDNGAGVRGPRAAPVVGSISVRRRCTSNRAARGKTTTRELQRQAPRRILKGEIFYSLKEATIVIEQWRVHYNQRRPHTSLGYRAPAPQAIYPKITALQTTQMIH